MKPVDPRLLPHLRPASRALTAVVTGSVAGGLLLVGQAFAVAGLLTAALAGRPVGSWAVVVAAVAATRALVGWLTDLAADRSAAEVTTGLRHQVLEAAFRLGPARLSRRRTGELTTLLTRGVAAVEPYLTRYLPALVVASVLPAATLLAIAAVDLPAALVVAATLPLVPVFAVLVGLTTRERADRQWRLLAALSGHFLDVVRGLPTLVAYDRATHQAGTIRAVTDRYRRATASTLRLAFASSAVLELVATLSVALVAVLVGLRLAAGSLDLHSALVVLLLAPEAYWPLRRVGAEFHAAAEGTATFEAVDRLLAEADDAERPHLARADGPGVQLRGVTVTYPDRATPALDGLTAHLPHRGITAVTGASGCGKSTLLAVLLGQLPFSGRVAVPGRPEEWQERVAWVPQRPWLLPGTVRDNVRLGRPDAADEEIWLALEMVHLAHLVAALPDGLDSEVAEDGLGLSAGERARLVLARVVVSDRPWVLLDEPTAHLDDETEGVILDTLAWLGRARAVVVVAHRPAVVALADRVLELPEPVAVEAPNPAAVPARIPADGAPAHRAAAHAAVPGRTDHAATGSATPTPGDPVPSYRHRKPAELGPRLALGTALGVLAAGSGVALTATAGWLIARAAEQPPVLMLMVAIVGVRTFGLARPVLRYAERLVSHDAALRLLARRRAGVYDALVPLAPGRIGPHTRRGEVLAALVDDVDAVMDLQLRVRQPVWTGALVAGGGVLVTALALPAAAPAVAAGAALGGTLAWLGGRWGARSGERRFVTLRGRLAGEVTTALEGAADLTAWQATSRAVHGVDRVSAELAGAARRTAWGVATGRSAAMLAAGLAVAAVVTAGTPQLDAGRVSGPVLALVALLPLALLDVLLPLADSGALGIRVAAADARVRALADAGPAVREPDQPAPMPSGHPLAARGLSAGWRAPAFSGVSFDLPPGGRLGVVGPSGSGKSTLAALLLRFLDPAAGEVTLGGTGLTRLPSAAVRTRVGLVDDDPHVFASSVFENVRLARPGATRAEVERVLRRVRLGPWLDALPRGLDTLLGDGQAAVSGGERARLGLARALLGGREVLVLDEPTAHLDVATARSVTESVLATTRQSLVWITHGRTGLDQMDRVLRLGTVVAPTARDGSAQPR